MRSILSFEIHQRPAPDGPNSHYVSQPQPLTLTPLQRQIHHPPGQVNKIVVYREWVDNKCPRHEAQCSGQSRIECGNTQNGACSINNSVYPFGTDGRVELPVPGAARNRPMHLPAPRTQAHHHRRVLRANAILLKHCRSPSQPVPARTGHLAQSHLFPAGRSPRKIVQRSRHVCQQPESQF